MVLAAGLAAQQQEQQSAPRFPVIGTAVGGIVGGLLGAFTGGTVASKVAQNTLDKFIEDDAKKNVDFSRRSFLANWHQTICSTRMKQKRVVEEF